MSLISKARRELRTIVLLGRVKKRIQSVRLDGSETAADVIEAQVDRAPESIAVCLDQTAWSYRELDAAANRVAHWARAQRIGRGDCVALLMENRPDFLATWIGLAKVGAHTALINTNLVGGPLAHAISVSGARRLVLGAELVHAYATAAGAMDVAPTVWVRSDAGATAAGTDYGDMDAALAEASPARPPVSWRDGAKTGDNLFFIYTSGTTGLPKAARFSHYRFLQVGFAYTVTAGITPRDVVYCCLPLYHTAGGVIASAMALLNGATLALRRKFSASFFWDDCREYDATVVQYIGELCRYLLNRPESPQDRNHRVRCAVGNGLRPDIWERFQTRFAIRDILEFYGATEGNFALLNIDNKVGSVGRVPPYLKSLFPVEIVRFDVESEAHPRGPDGFCIRCGPNEVGEAIGRIPEDRNEPMGKFEGYTDEAASRKKLLRDVFKKGDCWYRTGDLLTFDEEGYYYFVDRIGDTFRWKGENVATSEVAEVLSTCSGVEEANVYGVQVPGADGRAGMAALVTAADFDLKAFYSYVSANLPTYARPLFLRMRREMETTVTFKHRKVDLVREGYDPSAVTDPLYFRDDAASSYVRLDGALYDRINSGAAGI